MPEPPLLFTPISVYHRQHLDYFFSFFCSLFRFGDKFCFRQRHSSFKFGVSAAVFCPLVIGSIDFSWNSLFVSCNLIGQFCLSDPGNSSRTVISHVCVF